jgi:uncharacterized protein YjbI with pentapeptide repeats
MAGKHTRREAGEAGNAQPPAVDGLPRVSAAQLRREDGLDGALLEDADVSQWQASSPRLAEMGLRRVDLSASRLRGLSLVDVLSAATFCACKLDLANLRMSSIEDVAFVGCSLRGTDFYGASLESVRFAGCELHETDFTHASLAKADLRGSTLCDVRGTASLRGAIVEASQLIDLAPSLAAELGIRVEDAD